MCEACGENNEEKFVGFETDLIDRIVYLYDVSIGRSRKSVKICGGLRNNRCQEAFWGELSVVYPCNWLERSVANIV